MSLANYHLSRFKIAFVLTLAIFLLLADRGLKTLARLYGSEPAIPLLPGLSFDFQPNYYIAFSLPLGGPWLPWLLSLVTLIVLFIALWNFRLKRPLPGLLLTIIGFCAISNILDRYLYGAVIDYLAIFNLSVINLSDVLITLASSSLLFILFNHKE